MTSTTSRAPRSPSSGNRHARPCAPRPPGAGPRGWAAEGGPGGGAPVRLPTAPRRFVRGGPNAGGYRPLVTGPGEAHLARTDLASAGPPSDGPGAGPEADRGGGPAGSP